MTPTTPASVAAPREAWAKYERVSEVEARPWAEDDVNMTDEERWKSPVVKAFSSADVDAMCDWENPRGYLVRETIHNWNRTRSDVEYTYFSPESFAKHYRPLPAPPSKDAGAST